MQKGTEMFLFLFENWKWGRFLFPIFFGIELILLNKTIFGNKNRPHFQLKKLNLKI